MARIPLNIQSRLMINLVTYIQSFLSVPFELLPNFVLRLKITLVISED